ncbi:hypothetical protein SAMN04488063_0031 [Halopelagius inordinatus]|uniref:Uncharacterized protein n=1 Tax=Halopelagius inordinatus TaxID=553467 RepID=A0A1I2WYN4_9EURY|nr:hypothetical protein [Halopelagius inordinatus]SFH05546.1 hypothetical protein SAMN04488063_0031 [Halopelagius inordinatus]
MEPPGPEKIDRRRLETVCPDDGELPEFNPDEWPAHTDVVVRCLYENRATFLHERVGHRVLPLRDIVDVLPLKENSRRPLLNKDQCRYRIQKLVEEEMVEVKHVDRGGGKPEQRYWLNKEGVILGNALDTLHSLFGEIPEPVEAKHLVELTGAMNNVVAQVHGMEEQIEELEARVDELAAD